MKKSIQRVVARFKTICVFLLFIWALQLFIIDFISVKNTGMYNTFLPGDLLLISKIHTGARTPITPLTIPFLDWISYETVYSDAIQLKPFKLPKLYELKRNNLVAFNKPNELDIPLDRKPKILGRIIGLSGDTVHLVNSKVSINQELHSEASSISMPYSVQVSQAFNYNNLAMLGIETWQPSSTENTIHTYLTNEQLTNLKLLESVVRVFSIAYEESDELTFGSPKWNNSNFGPFIVPYKGMNIKLTPKNIELYSSLIRMHEQTTLETKDNLYFVNGVEATHFTFSQNYYFILGDNRKNTIDSRFFGPIPEVNIIGKPVFILFSYKPNKAGFWESVRPERWFTFVSE